MNGSKRVTTHQNLSSILLDAGAITPQQVEGALALQRSTGRRFGETLVEMGVVTEEDIGWALARQLGLQFVDLHADALDRELVASFPEGLLQSCQAVPLVRAGSVISMALADPTDIDAIDELERAAQLPLSLSVATPSAVRSVLAEVLGGRPEPGPRRVVPDHGSHFDVVWDRSGATFLLFHLSRAIQAGASEIHFIPQSGELGVFHRLGTSLVPVAQEPFEVVYSLLARLESLGGPAIDDREVHAFGQVTCSLGNDEILLDVSLLNFEEGIAITLRLRPRCSEFPHLEDLGLDGISLSRMRAILDDATGLVIVAGPGRAGCSTTLSSLMAAAEMSGKRCISFRGSPGPHIPTGIRLGLSRSRARECWQEIVTAQNADVVVLDGVLTGENIDGALSSAGSGRLLFVSTDWTDSFDLIDHLLARPSLRSTVASRLHLVIQQRMLWIAPREPKEGATKDGLERRSLFEPLIITDPMRDAIREGRGVRTLRALAAAEGFRSMLDQIRSLQASGAVTAAEAARALS